MKVVLLLLAVGTGAGVFLVLAGGAVVEVQVEFLVYSLGPLVLPDLNHGWKVIAFGDGLVGDELVAVLGKAQPRRCRAISKDDANHLLARGDDFHVVIDEADFDSLVFVDEELNVRLDFGDELASCGASFRGMIVMIMFVRVGCIQREGQR